MPASSMAAGAWAVGVPPIEITASVSGWPTRYWAIDVRASSITTAGPEHFRGRPHFIDGPLYALIALDRVSEVGQLDRGGDVIAGLDAPTFHEQLCYRITRCREVLADEAHRLGGGGPARVIDVEYHDPHPRGAGLGDVFRKRIGGIDGDGYTVDLVGDGGLDDIVLLYRILIAILDVDVDSQELGRFIGTPDRGFPEDVPHLGV